MDIWLGDCHLMRGAGKAREDFQSRAAVLCSTREEFERLLQLHLNKLGLHLLWTENVRDATKWFAQNGQNTAAMALAASVHEGNPVALAEENAVDEDGKPIKVAGYLTISDHTISPLPDQAGIPFWDAEWITPDLKELLFGQPANGDTLRTYFIVDATLRKNITGLFDLDVIDVPIQCLFKGDAAEELKESAPYLIDMTLPEGAWDDSAKAPRFHKDFFARHWGQNTGIFIRTTALMAEVWNHFRRFPRIQIEADKRWVYFRFWDPRIAPSYFSSIKDIPKKAVQWADMRNGNCIACIIGNQTDSEQAWSITPIWSNLKGFARIGQPILSDAEMEGFADYALIKTQKNAANFLRKADKNFYHDKDMLERFMKHCRDMFDKFEYNSKQSFILLTLLVWLSSQGKEQEENIKTREIFGTSEDDFISRGRVYLKRQFPKIYGDFINEF